MLRLSKITDYAVLILRTMALKPDVLMSASELAEQIQIGLPTVSKVLKSLVVYQLVESTRGSLGGYRLCRPTNQITIAQIIVALEGEMAITECNSTISTCTMNGHCRVKPNWQVVNEVIVRVLSTITLDDMIENLSTQQLLHRMMENTDS